MYLGRGLVFGLNLMNIYFWTALHSCLRSLAYLVLLPVLCWVLCLCNLGGDLYFVNLAFEVDQSFSSSAQSNTECVSGGFLSCCWVVGAFCVLATRWQHCPYVEFFHILAMSGIPSSTLGSSSVATTEFKFWSQICACRCEGSIVFSHHTMQKCKPSQQSV